MDIKRSIKKEHEKNDLRKWTTNQEIQDLKVDIRKQSENYGVPFKSQMRENNLLGKEMEIQQFINKEKEVEIAKMKLEREKHLINEIKLMQESKYCDEKRRMQLRMNSIELREFEDKLKTAYFRKEVDKFLNEKEVNEKIKKEKHLKELEQEDEQLHQTELDLLKHQENIQNEKLKYREYLIKQKDEAELAKQQEYEEFLRDKLLIDEAMRKIQDENKNHLQDKLAKQERALNDIIEYHKLRDSYKQKQAEQLLVENAKAEKFVKAKDEREELHNKKELEKRQSFENLQTKMCEKLYNDKLRKLQLDQAKEELALEEFEKFLSEKEKAELVRKNTIRQNLREMFLDQLAIKADILRRQREEEKTFQEYMMAKCELEEKAEHELAADRRRRKMEYRAAMDKVLADKRAQTIIQKEQQEEQERNLKEMEKEYDNLIKLEKIRLFKEHGKELLSYLPKGTLSKDFDFDFASELEENSPIDTSDANVS